MAMAKLGSPEQRAGRRMTLRPAMALLVATGVLAGLVAWREWHEARLAAALLRGDPETEGRDPVLGAYARRAGRALYAAQCAACHGDNGQGSRAAGVPALIGPLHLYDLSQVATIEQIARFGIRSGNPRAFALADMPAYGTARPYAREALPPQSPGQIEDLTRFVLALRGRGPLTPAARRGEAAFTVSAGCWDCHGHGGEGEPSIGAPALNGRGSIYGDDHDTIYRSIAGGRAGVSPAFAGRLAPLQLRQIALYVSTFIAGDSARPVRAQGRP